MKTTSSRKDTLRGVLGYVGRYRGYLVASLALCVITVASTLYVPILTGNAVDLLLGPGAVDFAALWPILAGILALVALTALAQWLMGLCNNRLTYCTVRDIRHDAFAHIQRLPLSYLDRQPTGDVVSRVIADVDQFADGLLMGFTQLFTGVLTIVGTLFFMFSVNAVIAAAVVVITPLSLLAAAFIARRTFKMFTLQTRTRGEQTALIDEMVTHQKVVRAFSMEDETQRRFDEVNERLEKCSLRAIFYSSLTNPVTRFVNALVYACVGVAGALVAVTTGGITVGQLSAFLSYANQYTKPFNEISGVVTELQGALACAARVLDLIAQPAETPDAPAELSHVDGSVAIRDVSFSYTPDRKLIRHLNLAVSPGQRIAIVGPTGCGKTTLINLLMRFYDVNEGRIEVSGQCVADVTRKSLRSAYGMVLQDTWLKAGTIRDNIKMGREDATDDEMIAAARATHAHSFIKRLPEGYDTVITEDGGSLSQGQKQLLCITRVMLCLPPMLILDEATSSIDTRTEQHIQRAFEKLMTGRTSFIVAHRLSTIQTADVILVMNQGDVIEQGTHEELLARGGFYARLYRSQFEQ
ncbi:MAG TPA: ABC transporter ATP-binding protein [Candidatus Limiplasma merdipullorum]|nr:ABC transporter ATP-binding protein [Clostridiales bacterium]HIR80785.1 ABC transporter ATP-binding protein [Candidatus Limiplasma merdipullorum]